MLIFFSRLQALMPPEDWQSICSSSRNTTPAALNQVGGGGEFQITLSCLGTLCMLMAFHPYQVHTWPLPDESNSTTSVSDTSTITENIETGKHIGKYKFLNTFSHKRQLMHEIVHCLLPTHSLHTHTHTHTHTHVHTHPRARRGSATAVPGVPGREPKAEGN